MTEPAAHATWCRPDVAGMYLSEIRPALPYHADQLALLVELLSHERRPPRVVLDLGAGDGVMSSALAARGGVERMVLVDLSEDMLAHAHAHAAATPGGPERVYVRADLSTPGWRASLEPRDRFDTVVSGFCIHHLSDERKRELYADIYELLAPGGMFLNLEHVASTSPRLERLHERLFVERVVQAQLALDPNGTASELERRLRERAEKEANRLADVRLQCRWLEEIGFEEVDVFFKWLEFALFGGAKRGRE